MKKISTGLNKLDNLLGGGFQESSSVMLLGPPKSGKTLFSLQFMFEGLKNKEYGICIITNNFPEKYVNTLENFGKVDSILQDGLLRFVDCYSVNVGVAKENTVFIIRVNGPTALTEISIALAEILKNIPKGSKIRIVLDSVSTLLLYNSLQEVLAFIQVINGKAMASGANSIFIVEEGQHDEKSITTLNSISDALIHLNQKENKIEITGFGLQNKSLEYSIKDGKVM